MNKKVQERTEYLKRIKKQRFEHAMKLLIDLWKINEGKQTKDKKDLYITETGLTQFQRKNSNGKQRISTGEFIPYAKGFLATLTKAERSLIINKFEPQIKRNNVFFHFPKKDLSVREKRVLNGLIKKEIIYDLQDKENWCVNPRYLRQGTILSCISSSIQKLEDKKVMDKSVCINLKPQKFVAIDIFKYS